MGNGQALVHTCVLGCQLSILRGIATLHLDLSYSSLAVGSNSELKTSGKIYMKPPAGGPAQR